MKIIKGMLIISVLSILVMSLTGCGSSKVEYKPIENNNQTTQEELLDPNEVYKNTEESVRETNENLKNLAEETGLLEKAKELEENVKENSNSFAEGAREESSVENPIKKGEVAKIYLNNTVKGLENYDDRYVPVYVRNVKKVSNEEALKDLRAYNDRVGKPVYQHEEKLDKFEWHEVIIEVDYKDFPTLSTGEYNVGPTFSVYKDPSDYSTPLMEAFLDPGTVNRIYQSDIAQYKLLYQWPIGREGEEILKTRVRGTEPEYMYFLAE